MIPIQRNQIFDRLFSRYHKIIGKHLIRALIINRNGTEKYELIPRKEENNINIFNKILSKIIDRFPIGSFGAGIYETEQEVYLIFEAGSNYFFITVLTKTANVDMIFIYGCLVTEKISMILEGKPTYPMILKFSFQNVIKTNHIKRKIGLIQKIDAKIGAEAFKLVLASDETIDIYNIVAKIAENAFSKDYKSTIGASIYKMEQNFTNLNIKVRFVAWNLAGRSQFKKVRQSYLSNAEAGILVFDLTNHKSFEYIEKYYEEIISASPKISLILIGNQSDSKRQVTPLEGAQFAEKLGFISYIESSPENRELVSDGIRLLALYLIVKHLVVSDIAEIDYFKEEGEKELDEILDRLENILPVPEILEDYELLPKEQVEERYSSEENELKISSAEEVEKIEIESDDNFFHDIKGRKFLRAYNGNEPFIFISYSHEDSKIVYREIEWLHEKGFKMWYDQGLPPSSNWEYVIPDKISKCAAFIVFISENAVVSKNVGREISYAIRHKSEGILPVFIEQTKLPKEIEFNLLSIQWISKYEWVDEHYRDVLSNSLELLL